MTIFKDPLSLFGGFAFNFLVNIIISTVYLERRNKFWLRAGLCLAFYLILFMIWPSETFFMNAMVIGYFTYYFFLPFFLSIGMLLICYRLRFTEGLFFALCAWFGENFVSSISGDIVLLMGMQIRTFYHYLIRIGLILCYLIIYYYLITRKSRFHKTIKVNNAATILVAIFGIAILTALAQVKSAYPIMREKPVTIVIYTYSGMFSLFTLAYMNGLFQNEILKDDVDVLQNALKKQAEVYKMNQENIDFINIKLHDLSKEISLINKENLASEDKEIIDSVSERIKIYNNIPKTGNEAMDTIIASKCFILENENIRFTCIADGKLLDFMPSLDIFSLIGNALDNAIEAVEKEKSDQRLIMMRLYQENGKIHFEMQNYCSSIASISNDLATSKTDKNYHGYGIKGMKYITKKYHGTFKIEKTKELFCVYVTIPTRMK